MTLHPAAFKSGPARWEGDTASPNSAAAGDVRYNLTDVDLLQLRDIAATATHRVTKVATTLGLAVLKREREERSALGERVIDLLARMVSLPMLGPVPSHGGERGQAVEVQRLRTLQRRRLAGARGVARRARLLRHAAARRAEPRPGHRAGRPGRAVRLAERDDDARVGAWTRPRAEPMPSRATSSSPPTAWR